MPPRVLVVEDDPQMGELLERGLTDEGYDVTWVQDGIAALIAIGARSYSAAAIDVMLPEMSGFEICRHIRRRGSTMPILMLTARDSIEDRVEGLDNGADDYLVKPFAFPELAARIRALVRRDSSAPKTTLQLGTLEIDTQTVRARIGGEAVQLSGKEFALLVLLVARAGETLSRDEILEEVWGTTRNIDPTVVDQYVSYVRRKLGAEAGVAIATVRGIGYRIDESASDG
ncbi:response regulator transcription factor [soil metagenome]